MLIVVVLPAPFGPTKPKISPSSTESVRSSTAGTRLPGRTSKVLVSPSVFRIIGPHDRGQGERRQCHRGHTEEPLRSISSP